MHRNIPSKKGAQQLLADEISVKSFHLLILTAPPPLLPQHHFKAY